MDQKVNLVASTNHISKRQRCVPHGLPGSDGRPRECLGLQQLLFGRRNAANAATNRSADGSDCPVMGNGQDDDNFTFRLERRTGSGYGVGEERIVLFRSDRPGAIGKIVFSVSPHNRHYRARAKIHVLEVKKDYRGQDLGGLLFSEAMASLRRRFMDEDDNDSVDSGSPIVQLPSSSIDCYCELDVEEDIRRHNKLIRFYEQLGCHLKPNTKVTYLNNNDGECYRKIPMQITVLDHDATERKRQSQNATLSFVSLVDHKGGFLPVSFGEGGGCELALGTHRNQDCNRRTQWLLSDDGEGCLQLRTTEGHVLVALSDGGCSVVIESEDCGMGPPQISEDWANFQLLRASDVCQDEFSFDQDEYCDSVHQTETCLRDAWMLLSAHGTFLSLTSAGRQFCFVEDFAFWILNGKCLRLEPGLSKRLQPLRQHQYYSKLLTKQTVPYVQEMRARYWGFKLKVMTLWEALNLVQSLPGLPFRSHDAHAGPSLRTVCFSFAEAARKAGHPDWVQLIALLHKLASVVNCIDPATARESKDEFDWTVSCRSRIVGCPLPDGSVFHKLRSLNFNNETIETYRSSVGMYRLHCGLGDVLLAWTGPEYMYHMLLHNKIDIPEDGFAMLRLFPLEDWHSKNLYSQVLNEEDHDMQPFVKDFHEFLQLAQKDAEFAPEMPPDQCEELWNSHYSHIASKYKADIELMW